MSNTNFFHNFTIKLKIQRRSHQPNNDHQRINNADYQQLSYRGPSGSCHDFWSYQQNNGEVWGKLMIVNPNYSQNIVEINLSLDARLQSVSSFLISAWIRVYYWILSAIRRKNIIGERQRVFIPWRCKWFAAFISRHFSYSGSAPDANIDKFERPSHLFKSKRSEICLLKILLFSPVFFFSWCLRCCTVNDDNTET